MIYRKPSWLIIFLAAIFIPAASFSQLGVQLLKIRIVKDEQQVSIACKGSCYISSPNSRERELLKGTRKYFAKADYGRVLFGGRNLPSGVKVVPKDSSSRIIVNNRGYRGSVIINSSNNRLSVINEIDVELYLYGVVPEEAVASWPEESLKTQAVISRTYALKNIAQHSKDGFDLCNTTHCQVYGGTNAENARTNQAVDETRGEVLFYNGKLADTFFHGSCGGHTENISEVWGTKAPEYLKGRSVKYAPSRREDFWKNKISSAVIEEKLREAGYNTGQIKKIKMSGTTGSGRTKNFKVYGKHEKVVISAPKFRLMVDPWKIKSVMLDDVSKKGDYFEFSGLGWGHGVGLCQESAKNMAKKGFEYPKILKYFYPGTYLAKWDEEEK